MNLNNLLGKFSEIEELLNENIALKQHLAKLEEQRKESEEVQTIISELEALKTKYEELKRIVEQNQPINDNEPEPIEEPKPLEEPEEAMVAKEVEKINVLLNGSLNKIEASLHEFMYKDKINKELHEELQLYKNEFRKEITTPILKNIIGWYDRVTDLHHYYSNTDSNGQEENLLYAKLLNEYKNLAMGLLDLLYDYDIEPFRVKPDDDYIPKQHRALEVVMTTDESKSKKIAECKRDGFLDVSTGRILRQAEVIIYKLEK